MEIIRTLISQKFALFNVGKDKKPVNRYGNGMSSWSELSVDALKREHNMESNLWGMRMGKQENGRYIMTLDFDCCGEADKTTGERMGCSYTKRKLDEYANIVDKHDGWYCSSTKGNANVLIDYTNVPEIISKVEQVGSKIKIGELEVLMGNKHQQVIPPSITTCKIQQKACQARAFKNDEPFYVLTEDSPVYPFILGLFAEYSASKQKSPKPTVPKQKLENKKEETKPVMDTDDKWVQLLYNVIGNEIINGKFAVSFKNWFHIAGILKTNGYDKTVLMDWTKIAEKDKSKLADASNTWDAIASNKTFPLAGLKAIAKEVNHAGYSEWRIKHDEYLPLEILARGENDTAKYIADQLRRDLIFCNGKWFMFDEKISLWRAIKKPHSIIISHVQDRIDESCTVMSAMKERTPDETKKKDFEDSIKKYKAFYKDVGKGAFTAQLINILETELYDSSFESTLDLQPYKMAYKNGILDLKTLKFRHGLYSTDLLTQTIPYNYEKANPDDVEFVRHEMLKICNMKPEHLEFYLSSVAYALTGDASKLQAFWCLRGQKASNGKSVIFEALQAIIPNYVIKLESNLFETTYGSRHKEISSWKCFRIAWVNELKKSKQDADIIKNMADGTTERYKVNYGGMDTMAINLKLFIVSNNTLNINADNGIARRLKMMQLDSEFSDKNVEDDYENCKFKMDVSFKELLQNKYKFAMMDLLYPYCKMFVDDGYKLKPYPADWAGDTEEVVADNNKMRDNILQVFEFGPDAKINKKEMDYQLSVLNISMTVFKDIIACLSLKVTYDSQKRHKNCKGVYSGVKLIEKEVEKEEEEEESLPEA